MLTRLLASVLVLATAAASRAAITANSVVEFNPGTGAKTAYWGAPLNNTAAALGLPSSNHNLDDLFVGTTQIAYADHSALTPFNPAFTPDEIVSFGAGGNLTLHLAAPVPTTGGKTLGVHTGTGLNAVFPSNGQNFPTAFTFTDDRVATVEISADNATWYSLGSHTFNLPSNYYSAGLTGGFDNGPGTAVANFATPFTGSLSTFDNLDFPSTIAALNNSAGGTWLDLSTATGPGTLPSTIQYVRFSLPAGSPDTFVLDALTAVPEPSSLLTCGFAIPTLLTRRRRNH